MRWSETAGRHHGGDRRHAVPALALALRGSRRPPSRSRPNASPASPGRVREAPPRRPWPLVTRRRQHHQDPRARGARSPLPLRVAARLDARRRQRPVYYAAAPLHRRLSRPARPAVPVQKLQHPQHGVGSVATRGHDRADLRAVRGLPSLFLQAGRRIVELRRVYRRPPLRSQHRHLLRRRVLPLPRRRPQDGRGGQRNLRRHHRDRAPGAAHTRAPAHGCLLSLGGAPYSVHPRRVVRRAPHDHEDAAPASGSIPRIGWALQDLPCGQASATSYEMGGGRRHRRPRRVRGPPPGILHRGRRARRGAGELHVHRELVHGLGQLIREVQRRRARLGRPYNQGSWDGKPEETLVYQLLAMAFLGGASVAIQRSC